MARKWLSVLLGLLICGGVALAVAPEIKDDAKFFGADAVKKANKEIRELYRKYGRDFLVETFPAVPGEQSQRVKAMSQEDRDKFFLNWANDRAEAAVVNGVYILVCKDPARIEIVINGKGRGAFDRSSFNKLWELLLNDFRQKQFDAGLQAAIGFAEERFAAGEGK
jgi:hypothetical protein